MGTEEKKLDNNNIDNHIFVTDDEGKKYRAEVLDIFKVEGYDDNDYIMYSFGESVDDSNERVYVTPSSSVTAFFNLVLDTVNSV